MPRERCIFTAISISLSLGWRQRRCRYTIRAGRNLPDKEFRYLRTVIVTAAVYWDFSQELAPHHLIFQHRAGVTPYTSTFVFAECCVFDKQSQRPGHCGPKLLSNACCHSSGRTFSRSYGAMLPSSFTRVLSSALEYSSRAPVSVCGTVVCGWSLVAFPGSRVSLTSAASRLVVTPHLSRPDLPGQHDYTLEPGHPTPGRVNLLRPHIALH